MDETPAVIYINLGQTQTREPIGADKARTHAGARRKSREPMLAEEALMYKKYNHCVRGARQLSREPL